MIVITRRAIVDKPVSINATQIGASCYDSFATGHTDVAIEWSKWCKTHQCCVAML